mmetsp:Transcript_124264/g.362799  ORF Transcript_124264/g.362799 Transcript_124264/m.362799 type:complete len:95 (-) Transcript_124264:628-912(-)
MASSLENTVPLKAKASVWTCLDTSAWLMQARKRHLLLRAMAANCTTFLGAWPVGWRRHLDAFHLTFYLRGRCLADCVCGRHFPSLNACMQGRWL